MYNVVWDEETGGILLTEKEAGGPPPELRPVFYEELTLLGLDRYWSFPRTEAPLLWATPGKVYYYRGRKVAEVSGGGFFQKPQVVVFKEGLTLYPVDVAEMLARNKEFLLDLTHRSLDVISQVHSTWRSRTQVTCVSFSGGKDSWVLLDLVQRALSPRDYVVVFNDTDMELSATHESVQKAKEHYAHLSFYTVRSPLKARESWRIFGPPSRIQRWCCTVHKSVPTLLLLRELSGRPNSKVLLFDGVRALESERRASYARVSVGAKHSQQINVSPILPWSATEVFLYLFWRALPLHQGYRFGLTRVGCVVCPLASTWSGFVQGRAFARDCAPFLKLLEDYARACGKKTTEEVREFLNSQAWGARAGGWFLRQARLVNVTNTAGFEITLPATAETNFKRWLKIAGHLEEIGAGKFILETKSEKVRFSVERKGKSLLVRVSHVPPSGVKGLFKAAAQKATFCAGCRTCEAECPRGAISFKDGRLQLHLAECRHCLRCFRFVEGGCLVAKSLENTSGKNKGSIPTYQTFGLKKYWLTEFFEKNDKFWTKTSLGPRQVEAFKSWLRDAGVLERRSLRLTPLGERLKALGVDSPLTWEILWVKLSQGSRLVRWFLEKVAWGETLSKKALEERLGENIAKRTRENAISALLGLFEHTPLHKIAEVERVSGKRFVHKRGVDDITLEGLLFALYSLAEARGRYQFALSDLLRFQADTPYGLFGLSREKLSSLLRAAATKAPKWLKVDLMYDLEAVYLAENVSPEAIINATIGL